jgi:hypothetical protein
VDRATLRADNRLLASHKLLEARLAILARKFVEGHLPGAVYGRRWQPLAVQAGGAGGVGREPVYTAE